MNQREREQALDRYIDQLIAGELPNGTDDAELGELCSVAHAVHQQRAIALDADFGTRMASQVALRVQSSVALREPAEPRPLDHFLPDLPATPPVPTGIEQAPRRRWLRELGQAVAAGLVLLLVGTLMVALLGGHLRQPDNAPQFGVQPNVSQAPSSPPVMISLDAAKRNVRAFLDKPTAALQGSLVTPGKGNSPILFGPSPDSALYLLTRTDENTSNPDTFIVDANGGSVLRAILPSQAEGAASAAPLSEDAARASAEQFARAHFSGQFDALSPVTYPYGPDGRYLIMDHDPVTLKNYVQFDWRLHSSDNRWLPTWVSVDVDRTTGKVVQYVARASGTENIEPPTLTEQQAEQIAIQHAAPNGKPSDISVTSAALMTTYWDQQTEIWVWVVELQGVPAESNGSTLGGVSINARTGAVVGDATVLP